MYICIYIHICMYVYIYIYTHIYIYICIYIIGNITVCNVIRLFFYFVEGINKYDKTRPVCGVTILLKIM